MGFNEFKKMYRIEKFENWTSNGQKYFFENFILCLFI